MSRPTVQRRLAELAHGIDFDALPRPAIEHAKRLILDTLGCALGSYTSKPSAIVRRTVDDLGGRSEATVIGSGQRTSCALAALANGTMIREADTNDYYFGRDPAHPSGNLAAVLAVAERQHASGRDVIAALAAAYEIQIRLCDFTGEPSIWKRGWHHGTHAQFSSAAAAARLLGGDAAIIATAMAIAGSHNNTLAQLQSGGISMMKATAEAVIAKGGVEAALLAVNGLTAPAEIFEGQSGWARTVAGGMDLDALVAPIERYRILDACIKPYAAVASAQAAIQAAIDIRNAHAPRLEDIERISVGLASYALNTPSFDPEKLNPQNKETADHSFHYCVAAGLLDGDCGEAQFTDAKLKSPELRAVMRTIELVPDEQFTRAWPRCAGGAVRITMKDGSTHERRHACAPGHPDAALSDEAIERKFIALSAHAVSERRAREIVEAVRCIETAPDLDRLMRLLVVGAGSP